MENVLYDIYLAEAEIKTNYVVFSADSALKQELLNSILKKHKITEAELDSSLSWYSGHLEKLMKINEKLRKSYSSEIEILKQKEEKNKLLLAASKQSETILPVAKERFLLTVGDLPNNAYTFKSETTLTNYRGSYELRFGILGLTSFLMPEVTLCIQCGDSILVKRETINQNGLFTSSIEIQNIQAQKIYGSIYFPKIRTGMTVLFYNFSLRYLPYSEKGSTATHFLLQ